MSTKLDYKLASLLALVIDHLRDSDDEKSQAFVKKYDELLED